MTDNPQFETPSTEQDMTFNQTFRTFTPADYASLFKKIAKMTGELRNIKKDRRHQQGWEYAGWDTIATAINHQLGENNLAFICGMAGPGTETTYSSKQGGTIYRYKIPFRMTLADGDTGAFITEIWYGIADDSSDKGIEKASTYANKGFLKKTFVIGVGDDPDAEGNDYEQRPFQQQAAQPPQQQRHPKASRPEENQNDPNDKLADALASVEQLNAAFAVATGADKFQTVHLLKRVGVDEAAQKNPEKINAALPAVKRYLDLQAAVQKFKPVDAKYTRKEWSEIVGKAMGDLKLKWTATGTADDDTLIIETLKNHFNPPVMPEVAEEEDFSIDALESIIGTDESEAEEEDASIDELGGFDSF